MTTYRLPKRLHFNLSKTQRNLLGDLAANDKLVVVDADENLGYESTEVDPDCRREISQEVMQRTPKLEKEFEDYHYEYHPNARCKVQNHAQVA